MHTTPAGCCSLCPSCIPWRSARPPTTLACETNRIPSRYNNGTVLCTMTSAIRSRRPITIYTGGRWNTFRCGRYPASISAVQIRLQRTPASESDAMRALDLAQRLLDFFKSHPCHREDSPHLARTNVALVNDTTPEQFGDIIRQHRCGRRDV